MQCLQCFSVPAPGKIFGVCARCKPIAKDSSIKYCSKDCQKWHWPTHKLVCRLIKPDHTVKLNFVQLPDDILIEIFKFVLVGEKFVQQQLKLLRLNSSTRTLVKSTSQLWFTIKIKIDFTDSDIKYFLTKTIASNVLLNGLKKLNINSPNISHESVAYILTESNSITHLSIIGKFYFEQTDPNIVCLLKQSSKPISKRLKVLNLEPDEDVRKDFYFDSISLNKIKELEHFLTSLTSQPTFKMLPTICECESSYNLLFCKGNYCDKGWCGFDCALESDGCYFCEGCEFVWCGDCSKKNNCIDCGEWFCPDCERLDCQSCVSCSITRCRSCQFESGKILIFCEKCDNWECIDCKRFPSFCHKCKSFRESCPDHLGGFFCLGCFLWFCDDCIQELDMCSECYIPYCYGCIFDKRSKQCDFCYCSMMCMSWVCKKCVRENQYKRKGMLCDFC